MYSAGSEDAGNTFQRYSWPAADQSAFNRLSSSTIFESDASTSSFNFVSPEESYREQTAGDHALLNLLVDAVQQEQVSRNSTSPSSSYSQPLPGIGAGVSAGMGNFAQLGSTNSTSHGSYSQLQPSIGAGVSTGLVNFSSASPNGSYSQPQPNLAVNQQHLPLGVALHQQHLPAPVAADVGSMAVTSSTDPAQAAGLVNFALRQADHPCFVLTTQTNAGHAAAANLFLIVQHAWRSFVSLSSSQQAVVTLMLPFLSPANSVTMGVVLLRLSVSQGFFAPSQSAPIVVDAASNPFGTASSICHGLLSTGGTPLDVVFSVTSASAAMQALAIARANLTSKKEVLVAFLYPPQTTCQPAQPLYLVRLAFPVHAVSPNNHVHIFNAPSAHDNSQAHQQGQGFQQAQSLQQSHLEAGPPTSLSPDGFQMNHQQTQARAQLALGAYQADAGLGSDPILSAAARMQPSPTIQAPSPDSQKLHTQFSHSLKASKLKRADYVIVTEETPVKNAAGALAKVLGRMSHLGQGCPLYTEKRSHSAAAVVGVGVKAIAVSRGYVCNEMKGEEVAFQPYIRHKDKQFVQQSIEHFILEKQLLEQQKQLPGEHSLLKSLENQITEPVVLLMESADRDQLEVAFDTFKIPQVTKSGDSAHSPVKVTAHSRINAVSSIIARLVDEAGEVELVTAGGKAMHIAMLSAIMARSQLLQSGCDILLLPRFHTVDTKSSHGYESVFLCFHIIRALPCSIPGMPGLGPCRFIIHPMLPGA
eukprot:gene18771-25306_t